jgi:hypothetical protein
MGELASTCLSEDELLALAAGALAEMPAAEHHLANCPTCSAMLAGAVRQAPVRSLSNLVGTTLGPYRLERAVAVKVLLADGSGSLLEARAAAAIDHRAVVKVYDAGVADGLHCVAMELVDSSRCAASCVRGRWR